MKNKSLSESFAHAFHGVFALISEERNLRIHISAAVAAIALSVILGLTPAEKGVIVTLCFGVISAEFINSAIENAVDLSTAVFNMYAKRAKDFAAGAVLMLSIGACLCALFIFLPYILNLLTMLT